ncbi:uncharacterized protein LOC142357025 isoform X1 [Convolutriloba macropyga]|uniref:uncharacterized protein LOC142357025 isoform X1 n=1 Tax=Convolutriloba macropyga TaxID=536237 RepID=UPI003F526316
MHPISVTAFLLLLFAHGSSQTECRDGWTTISGADDAKCYKLIKESSDRVHIDDFFVKYCDALTECTLQGGFLARPRTVPQLQSIENYLVQNFASDFKNGHTILPNGIWLGYKRAAFPVGDLDYHQDVRPSRIDPFEYYDVYIDCPKEMMNEELWRNSSRSPQPDDKPRNTDPFLIDERCVVKKKIGDNKIRGTDDFDCEDGMIHATFCEICLGQA